LINLNPHDDGNFYLRATAYDRSGSSRKAIDDYLTAIELFGNKAAISSDNYLAVARNYEKLGQSCDAACVMVATRAAKAAMTLMIGMVLGIGVPPGLASWKGLCGCRGRAFLERESLLGSAGPNTSTG